MFVKMNSSLQTKNYLGLSDKDLEQLEKDPYYSWLRAPQFIDIIAERGGSMITITSPIELNIHRDYMALVQPNPELHKFGLVSFNPYLSGQVSPEFHVRPYKAGALELDWLYEIRLVQ